MSMKKNKKILNKDIIITVIKDSFIKLNPKIMYKNPVMFIVEIGFFITLILSIFPNIFDNEGENLQIYNGIVSFILLITVLFANFAEAVAEGRGKAQSETLKKTRKDTKAKLISKNGDVNIISASELKKGDIVLVEIGDLIPNDGVIIEGIASVDESAITGESAPVLKEAGGDFSAVTGGTKVVSDWIKVEIIASPGESFLDKMISLVEGASRQKTPNEIALSTVLISLTIIFIIVIVSLLPMANYSQVEIPVSTLIALLVCLIPTTIGGLLSAIGIAGMDRVTKFNVIAMSGKAVEACGDVDTMILDKTGTITFGNRMAAEFIPVGKHIKEEVTRFAALSSIKDETPEGRSIIELARKNNVIINEDEYKDSLFIEFTAQSRMSGMDLKDGIKIRKGAADSIKNFVISIGGKIPEDLDKVTEQVSKLGGTPLVVCVDKHILGVIYLKDTVKPGLIERFARLRDMGIKTVMCTGDNPLTAATIAKEAGVDEFISECNPEDKIDVIKREQANMVDLDSDPTKILEVVEIGKQLLITRGALTTFSISNDVAKYFAIIPAMFSIAIPQMNSINIMGLNTPTSAVLSALIFNAIIIPLLIPIAMRGVKYKPMKAEKMLMKNILIYGLGGVIVPFIGIKLIDLLVSPVLKIFSL